MQCVAGLWTVGSGMHWRLLEQTTPSILSRVCAVCVQLLQGAYGCLFT